MTDPVQQSTEIPVSSENTTTVPDDQDPSSENTEKRKENESTPSEQTSTRRVTMPQDIRYATDQNDRDRLMKKYNNYQVSDVNACNIRFLADNRQRKNLVGRNEEEHSNLHSFAKTFNVNVFPGYQQPTKHSYKIFGTESNVRKCLIESMNRMFKRSNRSTQRDHNEHDNQQLTSNIEQTQETEVLSNKLVIDTSCPSESALVATVNPDSSITEEQKPATSNTEESQAIEVSTKSKELDEKSSQDSTSINPDSSINNEKPNDIEHEQLTFKPLERKHQFTFIMLISNQGQEVLKKNWNFFAGSLQQRLNVVVLN
ncbi:unnamed protein product, partial [Rotaria magnacalcarata]